jgi:hypothetical protein
MFGIKKPLKSLGCLCMGLFISQPSLSQDTEEIADGVSKIQIQEKGFALIPPQGWLIHRDRQGMSLFLEVTEEQKKTDGYQRSIQISRFSGALPIDADTGKQFQNKIKENFSKASYGVSGYGVREFMISQMADHRPSLVFYSDFQLGGFPMMQAHILVSSKEFHYLITYTDLAEHFDDSKGFLPVAWTAMSSFEILGEAPGENVPEDSYLPYALWGGGGVVILGILFFIKRRREKELLGEEVSHGMEEERDEDDDEDLKY